MPITISAVYRTYEILLREGGLCLEGATCPKSSCRAACGETLLVLTSSTVDRGLALWELDGFGQPVIVHIQAVIVLARCPRCGGRIRVLPADALPRKRYSLPIFEALMCSYAGGDDSLGRVIWSQQGERTPAHTTLHAWTEGLGAYALGRAAGELPGEQPYSRLLSESQARRGEIASVEPARMDVGESPPIPLGGPAGAPGGRRRRALGG